MRTLPLLAVALLSSAAAGCGQPFLSARVEVPEIRITQPPRDFPAMSFDPAFACSILAPLISNPQDCSGQNLDPIDIGDALDQQGVTSELRLTGLALHLVGADARGVRRAEVDLFDQATGAITPIARFSRVGAGSPGTTVVAETTKIDLVPFLNGGKLEPRVEVELDPTYFATGFSASVEAAFSVKVTIDYRSAM